MKNIKLLITIILTCFLPSLVSSQENNTIINPKGKLYLGFETGLNTITSFSLGEANQSMQVGLVADYYYKKHWSVVTRIKYFKTGVSFVRNDSPYTNTFEGAVLSIPVDFKWEFLISKKLKGDLKFGLAYNFETKSEYQFTADESTDLKKSFLNINTGFGLTYYISDKMAVYIDLEGFSGGGAKASKKDSLILSGCYYTTNTLLNFGIKYNLKK